MEIHNFFIILLAMLLSARVLGELATRLGAPAVIGELLAGVLLGPSLLGWVEPEPVLRLLAEIGITVRVLTDLNRQHSQEAQIVLGAAVLDDIIGVVLLALLYEFSKHGGASLAMVPRGEVGLIFAELGRSTGILSTEVYAGLIIVIALTTLLPPFALKIFYRRYPLE